MGPLDREEYLATVEQRARSETLVMMVMTEVMGKWVWSEQPEQKEVLASLELRERREKSVKGETLVSKVLRGKWVAWGPKVLKEHKEFEALQGRTANREMME